MALRVISQRHDGDQLYVVLKELDHQWSADVTSLRLLRMRREQSGDIATVRLIDRLLRDVPPVPAEE